MSFINALSMIEYLHSIFLHSILNHGGREGVILKHEGV